MSSIVESVETVDDSRTSGEWKLNFRLRSSIKPKDAVREYCNSGCAVAYLCSKFGTDGRASIDLKRGREVTGKKSAVDIVWPASCGVGAVFQMDVLMGELKCNDV